MTWIDKDFIPYFEDFEKIEAWGAFNLDDINSDIIDWIEKVESWAMVDFDLKGDGAVLNHKLIGSKYGFEEKIDKSELDEIRSKRVIQIEYLRSWVKNINNFDTSFDELKFTLWKNWNNPDFIKELPYLVDKFPNDIFDELEKNHKDLKLDSSFLITRNDINSLLDVDNKQELWPKIIAVNEKMQKTQEALQNREIQIVKDYTDGFKALALEKIKNKEKQTEVLKYFKKIWFDQFPKSITDKLITEYKKPDTFQIPWIILSKDYIDFKKWNFSHNQNWLNDISKLNLARLVNKMLSGDVDKPYPPESIIKGNYTVDPLDIKAKFNSFWLVSNWAWQYNTIRENVKKIQKK